MHHIDHQDPDAIIYSTNQLNTSSLTAVSVGGVSSSGVSNAGTVQPPIRQPSAAERRRRSRYRKRRNRIGLLLIFATVLLFAGLVVCVNTKEYVAGAVISVIGVLLGSSSMVLCLLTTDSCGRVSSLQGIRERVSSFSRPGRRHSATNDHMNIQRSPPRHGDGATASVTNSSPNIPETLMLRPIQPMGSCSLSGDFLDHLPPPSYETAEILRREDIAGLSGAVGGSTDYHYYKVIQTDIHADIHANPLASSSATNLASSTSHMCEECVQRQQQQLDDSGDGGVGDGVGVESDVGGLQAHPIPEEQVLLAPAIVVELPTYDEAIAEDR